MTHRRRDFMLDISGVVVLLLLLIVPFASTDPFMYSLTSQSAIGVCAALGIYIMLRLGLLSFSAPSFMALGGYAAAIAANAGTTNLVLLMLISAIVPALVALPLGALVLRLKGVYFIFITFVFNEILQIVIFQTPALTGGPNGITGVPPALLFGMGAISPATVVVVTVAICIVSALFTLGITHVLRPEFSSIEENETLAESLGVAPWKYRTIGFISSAAVSGLAGFALVNMLSTAHPSSFTTWSVNSYIAYVFVGGRGSLLGVVVGSLLLITMNDVFSSYAQLSSGLFGLLLVVVMMIAPGGIVGTLTKLFDKAKERQRGVLQPRIEDRRV
ncbi:branched-chain amino acid ABC transporter permease [Burkholderia cepacia]|uniref:branched-chain amino acid ABC transporter permease n=1 Tax=Burkholderia cepacia TaxID=292 RepID=UPI0018686BE1|nr:branched-chain amino acid ABC transporter permease [Burkholderia cepacia]MBE2966980.1 branched-chain amino acid ABC transporter permease [Burkholderia cepacia]